MPLNRDDIKKLREMHKRNVPLLWEVVGDLLRYVEAGLTMREGLGKLQEEILDDWNAEWIKRYTDAFDKAVEGEE